MDQRLVLVYLRVCAVTQTCRGWTSDAPQVERVVAKCSSIARYRRPAYSNSLAGVTREAFPGLARNHALTPVPDWLRRLGPAHS